MKSNRIKLSQYSDNWGRFWRSGAAGGLWVGLLMYSLLGVAQELTLESVEFAALPGDKLQFQLSFNGPAQQPKVFQTDNPARIAMDFSSVKNGMARKMIPVNLGVASGVHAVEASGRTRVVVNLVDMVPFDTHTEGDKVFLTLNNQIAAPVQAKAKSPARNARRSVVRGVGLPRQSLKNIDFRRGPNGEGRILVSLTDPNTIVDMQERGNKVVLRFINTVLPDRMVKALDVTDFATPVQRIETSREGNLTKMVVTPLTSDYDYSSFQSEGLLTLEFRPLTRDEKEMAKKKKFEFTGQRLSLNFQDIEVRSVLQILADFTNLNIVASDTVDGNITLRLNDVPWDQAMDIILKSKGLAKRQTGKVILVAPTPEINKLEKEELEAYAVKEKLAPLKTEIIQIKYAKAVDIQKVLMGVKEQKDSDSTAQAIEGVDRRSQDTLMFDQSSLPSSAFGSTNRGSILSGRGVVNIDDRTNVLIVKDTAGNLEAVRQLVNELDKPIRQVMIESRVVIANDDFIRQLGVRFAAQQENASGDVGSESGHEVGGILGANQDLITDLAVAGATSGFGLLLFKAGDFLLSLELSASQEEGKATVVSNPRLITTDSHTARIEQGVEIPFQTQSALGGTNTQFKKAVLKLEVTPHITPDDVILMDVLVQKDAPGDVGLTGEVAIDTREIETNVQVESGETVVLGGVFEGTRRDDVDSVPFFGELPGIGWMFRRTNKEDKKNELLIFITPKILKQSLSAL